MAKRFLFVSVSLVLAMAVVGCGKEVIKEKVPVPTDSGGGGGGEGSSSDDDAPARRPVPSGGSSGGGSGYTSGDGSGGTGYAGGGTGYAGGGTGIPTGRNAPGYYTDDVSRMQGVLQGAWSTRCETITITVPTPYGPRLQKYHYTLSYVFSGNQVNFLELSWADFKCSTRSRQVALLEGSFLVEREVPESYGGYEMMITFSGPEGTFQGLSHPEQHIDALRRMFRVDGETELVWAQATNANPYGPWRSEETFFRAPIPGAPGQGMVPQQQGRY